MQNSVSLQVLHDFFFIKYTNISSCILLYFHFSQFNISDENSMPLAVLALILSREIVCLLVSFCRILKLVLQSGSVSLNYFNPSIPVYRSD